MSSFKATLKVDGKEYEVLDCFYSFSQGVDDKGRPSSEVHKGDQFGYANWVGWELPNLSQNANEVGLETIEITPQNLTSSQLPAVQLPAVQGQGAKSLPAVQIQIAASDDETVMGWMIDPYKKTNGSVVFEKLDQASTMKELKFEDGYCVEFSEQFDSTSSEPMNITFVIAARKITVGTATHEDKWS